MDRSERFPADLGLRQGHGAEEAQHVGSNEDPEGVEAPVGKHQRRQEGDEDISHLRRLLR